MKSFRKTEGALTEGLLLCTCHYFGLSPALTHTFFVCLHATADIYLDKQPFVTLLTHCHNNMESSLSPVFTEISLLRPYINNCELKLFFDPMYRFLTYSEEDHIYFTQKIGHMLVYLMSSQAI